MDVSCDICLNVLISEKDDHNLELDFNYFCVNNIFEICVKTMIIHFKMNMFLDFCCQ